MNEKRSKTTCYQLKYGNSAKEHNCDCASGKQESSRYNNEKLLEQLQKKSEAELEKAMKVLKKTENAVRESRRICGGPVQKPIKKPPTPTVPCKHAPINESRDAIKRLTNVAVGRDCECPDGKTRGKSSGKVALPSQKLSAFCAPGMSPTSPSVSTDIPDQKESKELPKKPRLTTEELSALLDQEEKDVESAWFLISETKETVKKPCPKQEKAREAVRALMEPKKEELPLCSPPVSKEPLPFFDPEPDDMSPEVAANMMYTQERGIKMISCPEETVRHLFAEQLGSEEKHEQRGVGEELIDSDFEDTAEVDDSVFTRTMSQRDSSSRYYDAPSTLYDRKTEFVLQEKETKCLNGVQLRGNCAPWFPGYFTVFPDQVESGIQVAKSPSGVFQRAWMAAKPNTVPEADLHLVE